MCRPHRDTQDLSCRTCFHPTPRLLSSFIHSITFCKASEPSHMNKRSPWSFNRPPLLQWLKRGNAFATRRPTAFNIRSPAALSIKLMSAPDPELVPVAAPLPPGVTGCGPGARHTAGPSDQGRGFRIPRFASIFTFRLQSGAFKLLFISRDLHNSL